MIQLIKEPGIYLDGKLLNNTLPNKQLCPMLHTRGIAYAIPEILALGIAAER
jgi:hypothetical protein